MISRNATPTLYLDYSNVIATRQTIFLNRLPILTAAGATIYKDVTIQLRADANGVVSVFPATPTQVLSPPVLSANFRAGIYVVPSVTTRGFALTGPAPVPGSVMSKWQTTVTPTKTGDHTCAVPATFYVGPLSAHPYRARLVAAGITSTEYSYGVIGMNIVCNYGIDAGDLVGFSQSGALLTIADFSNGSVDTKLPIRTFTYRLQ